MFRWPTRPQAVKRLARPLPVARQVDYAWRAAHPTNNRFEPEDRPFAISTLGAQDALGLVKETNASYDSRAPSRGPFSEDGMQSPAYEWKLQDWSDHIGSQGDGSNVPSAKQHRPGGAGAGGSQKNTKVTFDPDTGEHHRDPDFDWVLNYKTKLLAENVFRFDRNLCNQRFELILEELLFLGHPVCIGDEGTWQWEQLYSSPKSKEDERERGERERGTTTTPAANPKDEASLKSFHFILVLDRPDPALGGNANLTRFIDVYYEQLAVKMTAALHYEQSRDGYVEKETDLLVDLIENSESYGQFLESALEKSSLARAIREIFNCVQNQRLAHVTVGEFELDLQMPWYHSELLVGEQDPEGAGEYSVQDERDERWDPGFGKGWRVRRLLPWNTLLFIEGPETSGMEAEPDEMTKFREVLTPDISLADAAALLDWDLEKEVMRMARYMIYLKKAKVSDVVHPKLLNIYVLPARSVTTLSSLSQQFQDAFPPTTPALETILAAVSASPQAFAHFVPSDDHVDLYHQILIWLLKNDTLIMLHVRFRLVATEDVKRAVHKAAQRRKSRSFTQEEERGRRRKPSGPGKKEGDEPQRLLPPPPTPPVDDGTEIDLIAHEARERSSPERRNDIYVEETEEVALDFEVPEQFEESFIMEPGRATPLEQAWIEEIARRRPEQQKRFLVVCKYLDGRTSFDEIQYRSQLKRKHFRTVVVAYDDWLLSLLHP